MPSEQTHKGRISNFKNLGKDVEVRKKTKT